MATAPTTGTITSNNRAGNYPFTQNFVHDATGASALLLFVTTAGGYGWDPTATFGGTAMTLLTRSTSAGGQGTLWTFGLNAPAQSSATVAISKSNEYCDMGVATAVNVLGSDTTAPFDTVFSVHAQPNVTLTVATTVADCALFAAAHNHYAGANALTVTGATALSSNTTNTNHVQTLARAVATSAGSYSIGFAAPYNTVGGSIVAIKPAAGGGDPPPSGGTTVTLAGSSATAAASTARVSKRRGVAATSQTTVASTGRATRKRPLGGSSATAVASSGALARKQPLQASSATAVTSTGSLTIVKPSNRAVTKPAGVATLAKSGMYTNTVAFWAFNETTGTTPNLANPSDYISYTGPGARTTDAVGGHYAPFTEAGTSSALTNLTVGDLGIAANQPFTVAIRMEPVGFSEGTDRTILSIGSGNDGGIEINEYGTVFEAFAGGWRDFGPRAGTTVQTLVLSYDGTTLRSYINGVAAGSNTLTFGFPTTAKIGIGLDQRSAFANFREKIYEVGIIASAWSASDAAEYDANPLEALSFPSGVVKSLAGSSTSTVTSWATIAKRRAVTAASATVVTSTAKVSRKRPLVGSATPLVTSSATVSRKSFFGGSSATATASSGGLSRKDGLSGSSTTVTVAGSAQAGIKRSLSGSSVTQAVATSGLTVLKQATLSGASQITVVATGRLDSLDRLRGASATATTTSAKLGVRHPLSGASQTVAVSSGGLAKLRPVGGSSTTVATASGNLVRRAALSAASQAAVSASGNLVRAVALRASSQTALSLSGSLTVGKPNTLSGASQTATAASGRLSVRARFGGASATVVSATPAPAAIQRSLSGASRFAVSSTANSSAKTLFSGSSATAVTSAGAIARRRTFGSSSHSTAQSTAKADIRRSFSGSSASSSAASGMLRRRLDFQGSSSAAAVSLGRVALRRSLIAASESVLTAQASLLTKTKFPAVAQVTLSYKRLLVSGTSPITVTPQDVSVTYGVQIARQMGSAPSRATALSPQIATAQTLQGTPSRNMVISPRPNTN